MKGPKVMLSEKEKGFFNTIFDLFRSLKLTIFLLIILAVLSVIGTLIKQNASSTEYIQRYGIDLYNVLDFFNLFDMYHSWWFSAILILLVINLIACSIHRFPAVLKQIFRGSNRGRLEDLMLKTLPYVEKIPISNSGEAKRGEEISSYLKERFKNPDLTETDSAVTLYSEKGRFSRLGVPLTHLSIIIILIGGLAGSIYGFRGFVNILEGETVNQIYLRIRDKEIAKTIDFAIRCDDFQITYYDLPRTEKHVKEYASLLTILENEKEVLKKTVKVNHPLYFKGLAFYQSDYGSIHDFTLGIQWKDKKEKVLLKVLEGETVPIPNTNTLIRLLRYAPQIHNFGEGIQVALFRPKQEPEIYWVLKGGSKLGQQRNDEFMITLERVNSREYTGLQVTKDPGVWIVWMGSGLMVLGLIIAFFFSHQRVWVRIPKQSVGEVVIAGSTNKNRLGFEKTFNQLVEGVRKTIKFQ
jgi:cytochrome c biogenesis protein